jgi:hypothetical protein
MANTNEFRKAKPLFLYAERAVWSGRGQQQEATQ